MAQVTQKGQVTIPAELRRKFGLHPNTEVEVVDEDGKVVVRAKAHGMNRGRRIAEGLRGRLKGKTTMTTDELMRLTRGEDDGTLR